MAQSKYTIKVNTKGAKKSEREVKGLSKSLNGLAKSAALAAGAYIGAGALLGGIRKSIDAFGEQELAEKKLESALGRTSRALLAQASALQQVTTFGDEAIITAQSLIASFVDDEEQIKKATKATLDLAAAKGMDLTAAADLVSKTLGSSTNAMSRYGIEVTGAVGSTERLESLTSNIAKVFGGQASAHADTMSGAITQMSNATGDAAEKMGALLAPAVIKTARFFKGAAEAVGAYLDNLRDLDKDEIVTIENQDRLAVEIGKTEKELSNLEQSFHSIGKLGDQTHWTDKEKEKYQELEDKLKLLNAQYSSLSIVMNTPAPVMTEDIKTATEQIELATIRQKEQDNVFTKVTTKTIDFAKAEKEFADMKAKQTKEQLALDLKTAALSGQSASEDLT